MEDFYIVCGLGRVGARVLEYLQAAGMAAVVVDLNVDPLDPSLNGAAAVRGDFRQLATLQQAGLDRAKGVLILSSDDLGNLSAALAVAHHRNDVPIVVRMFNPTLIGRLGALAGRVTALSTSQLTAPILSLIAQTGTALGTFALPDGATLQVAERVATEGSDLVGKTLGSLRSLGSVRPLAHGTASGQWRFLAELDESAELAVGDRVAAAGPADAMKRWLGEDGEPKERRWAGWLRRQGRVLVRMIADVDLPVKIAASVLAGVIVVSVVVFHFGMKNDTLVDAFYRTISLVATGADMRGADVEPGSWQKAFVSVLRLIGAALTAAFTAILTNYLVRANLGGALEVGRIPDRGHIVVCGLGNVGFRVVQDLIRQGRSVAAVERNRDNPFVATARRLGAAVIVGDATVREVLRQAKAPAALSLIAATNNELANLEIVLLAREVAPELRVVLRLTDPQLARTLRETADIRLALSIPELAAPAFVAALFGDRLRGIMLLEGRLLAAVDLIPQPGDAFLEGRTIRSLAIDFGLLPLRLTGPAKPGSPTMEDATLAHGDRLTAIVGFGDLQRLMKRERPPAIWKVVATQWPLTAREGLRQMLRGRFGIDEAEAERRMQQPPVLLGQGYTRGEAEDLSYRMNRERVATNLQQSDSSGERK